MTNSSIKNNGSEIRASNITSRLDRVVDPIRDHILGNVNAEMTLVEYGSYACPSCQEAHQMIINLRDRFGDQLRYVFRHKPLNNNKIAEKAAILAEFAGTSHGKFWEVHDALMIRSNDLKEEDLKEIIKEFDLSDFNIASSSTITIAQQRVQEDIIDARRSDVILSPTFFINNREYEGPWDESSLSEALIGSLGHSFHTATIDFVQWGPSAGFMLLVMSLLAIILTNSPIGKGFEDFWITSIGIHINNMEYTLSLREWINDGLLSLFFLVVGLELKREFTVGRLSSKQAAALPIIASFGGVIIPAIFYIAIAPSGPLSLGWGVTISTDTAFAIAIIVMLGTKVPVELRIFLTATAIVDDLISIIVVAIFYSSGLNIIYVLLSIAIILILLFFNHNNIYNYTPYVLFGISLWVCLHQAGLHPTLAGVIVALIIPTNPPANLHTLNAQALTLFKNESLLGEEQLMRSGPSPQALRVLDNIHDRIESPAAKLLRTVEPWSSYFILPIFALANAGVLLSHNLQKGDLQLMLAIFLGLVVGKPLGIFTGSWLATHFKLAVKPPEYTWLQLLGAGILAGMGFTMSLFIAAHSYPQPSDLSAAKIAIFAASITAGTVGSLILHKKL